MGRECHDRCAFVRLLPAAMDKKLNRLPERYVLVTFHRPAMSMTMNVEGASSDTCWS